MKNKKPSILVVGSFVLDQIAECEVCPREGQTILGGKFHTAPGGKGANQAVQAARLGADVTMVGKIGKDGNGETMRNACLKEGLNLDHILVDPEEPTGCSVIILEKMDGQTKNRIIVLSGSNMTIQKEEIAFLEEEVANYDLVMLQLEIPMEINEQVAAYAYAKGVPVMLNSAPSAPLSDEFLSHLAFISPNEHEAQDMTSIVIEHNGKEANLEQAKQATTMLRDKGVRNVVITLGDAGAVLHSDDGFFHYPCVPGIIAVDPTAAGDSFVGAFCTAYCCGMDWEKILRFANQTAAITVSNMGAMPSLPKLEQVLEKLPKDEFSELNVLL